MVRIVDVLKSRFGDLYSKLKKLLLFDLITLENLKKAEATEIELQKKLKEENDIDRKLAEKPGWNQERLLNQRKEVLNDEIKELQKIELNTLRKILHDVHVSLSIINKIEEVDPILKERSLSLADDLPKLSSALEEWENWLEGSKDNLERMIESMKNSSPDKTISELIEEHKEWGKMLDIAEEKFVEIKNEIENLRRHKIKVALNNMFKSYKIYCTRSAKRNITKPGMLALFKSEFSEIVKFGKISVAGSSSKSWRYLPNPGFIRGELKGARRIFFTIDETNKKIIIYEFVDHGLEYSQVNALVNKSGYTFSKTTPLNEFYPYEAAA